MFSQEIFHKERIPAGSHKENDALQLSSCWSIAWTVTNWNADCSCQLSSFAKLMLAELALISIYSVTLSKPPSPHQESQSWINNHSVVLYASSAWSGLQLGTR